MNLFGMFFSFMLPGILIGALLAASIYSAAAARRRNGKRA